MKAAAPPLPPKPIAKLPEQVVNKIAAGEIIQRPANALKELIENALDAGSTTIKITVKDGGTKLLQIQDNGSGIRKADLPILCERFTTSKIKEFEDLSSIGTYGFRGEALASISHVAHLTITSKTRDDPVAWKAAYADGIMVPFKTGGVAEAVPCAGNDGTLIVVEDLFFNHTTRLKSLRSASDEYSRILQVVTAYSIHNSSTSFVCKKGNSNSSTADINTSVGSSTLDNIGVHYGDALKRELVEVVKKDDELGVEVKGWFSGANYSAKKGTFLFFINNRHVDSTALKRAFEAFYNSLLPKGSHPFVYLSLSIDPAKVDVNVHPTKKEVGFEDEEEIVQVVCEALGEKLAQDGGSRSFKVQTLLPGASNPNASQRPLMPSNDDGSEDDDDRSVASTPGPAPRTQSTSSNKPRKTAPNKLVRTDANTQTLDAMFQPLPSTSNGGTEERPTKRRKGDVEVEWESLLAEEKRKMSSGGGAAGGGRIRIPQSECMLRSVKELRKEVIGRCHKELETIVKNHIFVGVADLKTALTMIQYQTKLYLVNHSSLSEELFYQLGLRQFGRFTRFKLSPPARIKDLVKLALRSEVDRQGVKLTDDEIATRIHTQLIRSRAMLDEYFGVSVSAEGQLESLPLVLPGYTPLLDKLPLFLIRIGVEVDWEAEKECFETFLRELAFFYTPTPLSPLPSPSGSSSLADETESQAVMEAHKRQIQHVLFPAAKMYLLPSENLLKQDFIQATSLESLFKVFERC